MKLKYCSEDFLEDYKVNFDRYYEIYRNLDKNQLDNIFNNPKNIIESDIDFDYKPLKIEGGTKVNQGENIKILFKSLKNLPAVMAIQEKLWVAMYNTYYKDHLWTYVNEIKSNERFYSKLRGSVSFYRGHKRALIIHNLSSMWWIGYNLYDEANKNNPYWLLDFYVEDGKDDITGRSIMFLSSNITNNKEIRLGIVEGIKELTEEGLIKYNRYNYIDTNKYLNMLGSVQILDLFTRDEIKSLTKNFLLNNTIE